MARLSGSGKASAVQRGGRPPEALSTAVEGPGCERAINSKIVLSVDVQRFSNCNMLLAGINWLESS